MGMDFLPFIGSGKSIAQLISGTDLITGEPTPRWIEAVGILAGVFGAAGIAKGILKGGSSVLKHGDEVADVAKMVKKSDKANDAAKVAKRADKATDAVKNTDDVWHSTEKVAAVENILEKGIHPDYLNPNTRFGKAFYVAESPNTSIAEMGHYGINPSTGLRFSIQKEKMKVLDLTKPSVAKQWGYAGGEKTLQMRELGEHAKAKGFNAIRFNSERADGVNIAVLDDFNKLLKPEMVTPISK
jgi:hypothetical protein